MYTLVPFRGRRELAHTQPSLFDDRFFRSFFDMNDFVGNQGFRVDVREKGDGYTLEAELPGVKEDQINLTVDNDVLTIAADLNTQKKEEHDSYCYSERRTGHFERSFNLEGIEQDAITAEYVNGVLTVNLPKNNPAPQKAQRRIAIGGNSTANGSVQ